MTSNDSKATKIQKHFLALSELAPQLNTASDHLTRAVALLDESLKKLNVGLTAWVTFRSRGDDEEPQCYDEDQIGYSKVNGTWGISLRRIWGDQARGIDRGDGPWLFNDAPRELRVLGVDRIPELIEALGREVFDTTRKIQEKAKQVLDLVDVLKEITDQPEEKPMAPGYQSPRTLKALADIAKGVQGAK